MHYSFSLTCHFFDTPNLHHLSIKLDHPGYPFDGDVLGDAMFQAGKLSSGGAQQQQEQVDEVQVEHQRPNNHQPADSLPVF
jgi:hypothetical protein